MNEREIWSLRIAEAASDPELVAIDAALRAVGAAWAGPLRFAVGARRRRLKVAAQPPAPAGEPLSLDAFATAYGIGVPDGRRLYRYRLGDAAFERLEADLRAPRSVAGLATGTRPGLFVLWASEWFRRGYRGGGHRWADLVDALGMAEDQAQLREITARGLAQWRRPVARSGDAREFLGSLAREGGFPTAAVEDGGRGWAQEVLKAIVAPLLSEPAAEEERAHELASTQRRRLPQLFGDDEFVALCADLALAIVRLRREADAPAAAAGIPVLAWLELNRPGWQDRLPLTTAGRAAAVLVEGLMSVEASAGGAVGVARLLVREGDRWTEAVRLTLDGVIDGATMRGIDRAFGRLRAFAAGAMARYLPGELALADAPVEGETEWSLRSSRRARAIHPLPFAAAIELDLRAGEQRVARIALPGGKPRRGALRVAVADGDASALRVIGAGSGQFKAERLVLQVPADWRVDTTLGETAEVFGRGSDGSVLWQVSGGAFVTDPQGDRFRIRCVDRDEPSPRIELIGNAAAWTTVTGDVDLFVGDVLAQTRPPGGKLFTRAIGAREWRPVGARLPVGHYDLGWREDRLLRDRRRVAVLPGGAELRRSGALAQPRFEVRGLGACAILPDPHAPLAADAAGTEWRLRPEAQPVHRFAATVRWPDAPPLDVATDCPCAASIARWDGRVLAAGSRIALGELTGLVAVNAGRVQMSGELVDRGRRVAAMTWEVVDELPLASVAPDLASLLLPTSIDAEVRIEMHDGQGRQWRVRPFAVELAREGAGVVASKGIVAPDAALVGRALVRPHEEVPFGHYSLLTDANHRPAPIPAGLAGDWLLYLRAGAVVLSRPLLHRGESDAEPFTALGHAMAKPQGSVLAGSLNALLDAATRPGEEGAAIVAELLALICSLRGLPPKTFQVLDLLASRPQLLARLALAATPDQRDAVLALSDGLPFAWCAVPRAGWDAARGELFASTLAALAVLGDDAPRFAKEAVDIACARVIAGEPLLAPVLGEAAPDPLATVAMAFMNRGAVDRVPRGDPQRYRRSLAGDRLPAHFVRFDERVLDTLDAPCAAALAVLDQWVPRADDVRHLKTVARSFPTYFADAFAASLQELS